MTTESPTDNRTGGQVDPKSAGKRPSKTPLYEASHARRYQRQAMIKEIQGRTNRRLICYVSGRNCGIDDDDTLAFVDLLHNVPADDDIDLLLHTTGGGVNAAEKLMGMVRRVVGTGELRIIVPDYAKSAGTLMVLGADSVVMSDMSELGPIDPQRRLFDRWQSVQNYLDAYSEHEETLTNDPSNTAARLMLNKLDPVTLILFKAEVNRARQAAEGLLKRGMFRNGGNWSRTANELLDTARWLSHGQMISWEDARDPQIGLVVEYLEYESEDWQDYWRIYCLQRLAIEEGEKLFESGLRLVGHWVISEYMTLRSCPFATRETVPQGRDSPAISHIPPRA